VAKQGVNIRTIDGSHIDILKPPYATALAAALTQALREAA
jgi:thioesterase domain-containing protein